MGETRGGREGRGLGGGEEEGRGEFWGGGGNVTFALKGLFHGIRLRREEMKSESRECVLNGTKVKAILNKITFFNLSIQSQFLPAFPYINYKFYPRGIPFHSGEGGRT